MQKIPDEIVERMVALTRRTADAGRTSAQQTEIGTEARSIVALLPDQDLAEAREFLIRSYGVGASYDYQRYAREGAYDDNEDLQRWLSAIKRGRELERGA